MYYYFYSEIPRAIFLSGVYLGVTSGEPKKCEILTKNTFIEARSTTNSQDCFSFVLSDETLKNPPSDLVVTDLKGGYLFHFKSKCTVCEFKILAQEKFSDAIVTVFSESGIRLSIETPSDFYALTLYDNITSAEIKRLNDKRLVLIILTLKDFGTRVMIFDISAKTRKLYDEKVTSYCLCEDLVLKIAFKDVKKHVVTFTLDYSGGEIIVKNKKVSHNKDFNSNRLIEGVIPYAFLEDFLVGDDYLEYLSDDIKEKTNNLKDYLGEFTAIIPPPLFRAPEEIGLVYKKTDNLYYVDYFTFTVESQKITNLKKLDY